MEDGNDKGASFAIEHVAAKLVPFDLADIGATSVDAGAAANPAPPAATPGESFNNSGNGTVLLDISPTSGVDSSGNTSVKRNHALWPISMTGGLVFPYNPAISENVQVNYDAAEITHSNESYHFYKNTSNVRISLTNCVWTCDTFDNAIYALAALHFLRSYSNMDFGRQGTGKPPSPMWFSAYGNYAFNRVPVFLEKADWTFQNDVDYVGIPEPGSTEYEGRTMITSRSPSTGPYTWMPMKFEVSAISLIVQHSPNFWLDWSLKEYRSGAMLRDRGGFHRRRG
jgi:hypothetical protein